MDTTMKTNFENLRAENKDLQYEALMEILEATKSKVDWAYEVWDQLVEQLTDSSN